MKYTIIKYSAEDMERLFLAGKAAHDVGEVEAAQIIFINLAKYIMENCDGERRK